MSQNSVKAQARQQELADRLERGETISIARTASRFGVNPMTIRRDLAALEQSGAAVRCFGGAIPARRITFEFAFDRRHQRNLEPKRRIGAAAAGRVQPGQTVFLDTGTTTLEVARALARRGVACRIATSSLVVASELWGKEQVELILLGGRVRRGSPDLVGPATEMMLERLTADIAFLGSDGIDPRRGSFSADIDAARIASLMAANARRVVLVCDGSKFGAAGAARYLKIDEMDELITDRNAPKPVVAALRRKGVRFTFV